MTYIDLKLHPDATFQRVNADKIQLRSPDGRHLTFQDEEKCVEDILSKLKSGLTSADDEYLRDVFSEAFIGGVLEPLKLRGLLKKRSDWENTTQYGRLLDNYLELGGRAHDVVLPRFVHIIGEGVLAEQLKKLFVDVAAPLDKRALKETLIIGVSDTDDTDALMAINQMIIDSDQLGTFIRWRSKEIVIGPFVSPKETACFDCVEHRGLAAALYVDEAYAYHRDGKGGAYTGGPVLDALVATLMERHVQAIRTGGWSIAAPGNVHITDPISLETTVSPVLRLPRCPSCGGLDSDAPVRAIRDLT